MKKILFLIHDLGQGGAEKVLVNLVNHMDRSRFDITVMALFGGGVNEQFLSPEIRYITVFPKAIPGNSRLMKLLSPRQLHTWFIKDRYDIEVAYLEGPSARIISGCPDPGTKLVSWIHSNGFSAEELAVSFRSVAELNRCYERFSRVVCVSEFMRENFCKWVPVREKCTVLYNTVESDRILELSCAEAPELEEDGCIRLTAVGSLKEIKGYDRLLRIMKSLLEDGLPVHLYLLGIGPLEKEFRSYIAENHMENRVTLLGYRVNPYAYVAKCDLFVCSSHSEGFSTAATEALIVGTPVCTVEVSGMKEMLGEHDEYGIVTPNSEEALYEGLKRLLEDPALLAHYRTQAAQRGKTFRTENTVRAAEEFLLEL